MGIVLGDCPLAAALPDIPISDCPSGFGQIQKVIFQRMYSTSGVRNTFVAASADPTLLASWTPLLSAADGTKVVVSPYIQAPAADPGEAITYGGGNDTIDGIEIVLGRRGTAFTAELLNVDQATVKALKQLSRETLGVYLVDEYGQIGMLSDGSDTPVNYYPIEVRSFFVSDKGLGGREEPDKNTVSWTFVPNWSDNLVYIQPSDFNPLTGLTA